MGALCPEPREHAEKSTAALRISLFGRIVAIVLPSARPRDDSQLWASSPA
jgi:hypothetical protein